jgi:hypothetical protein
MLVIFLTLEPYLAAFVTALGYHNYIFLIILIKLVLANYLSFLIKL